MPLIDDLNKLWNDHCMTYDAYRRQNFVLHAILLWMLVKGHCYSDYDLHFYGILINAIELEYLGVGDRVVLIKNHWFDKGKEVIVHHMYGLIEIKHASILRGNESFVLAA